MSEIDVTLRGKLKSVPRHWALRTCCLGRVSLAPSMVPHGNGPFVCCEACVSIVTWLTKKSMYVYQYLHHLFYNRTIYSFETCSMESIEGKMWVRLGEYPSSLFPATPPYVLYNAYVVGALPKLHTCSIWMFPQPKVNILEKLSSLKTTNIKHIKHKPILLEIGWSLKPSSQMQKNDLSATRHWRGYPTWPHRPGISETSGSFQPDQSAMLDTAV